jgi:hypothetical protein
MIALPSSSRGFQLPIAVKVLLPKSNNIRIVGNMCLVEKAGGGVLACLRNVSKIFCVT